MKICISPYEKRHISDMRNNVTNDDSNVDGWREKYLTDQFFVSFLQKEN